MPPILPNGEHTFEVTSSSIGVVAREYSPGAWRPLDRIEITSLLWQDGLVEGDPEPALQQGQFDTSKAMHIRALMTLLRDARGTIHCEPSTRSIARAMTFDIETRQFRDSPLNSPRRLRNVAQRSGDGQDFERTWLTRTIAECRQWAARIVVPKVLRWHRARPLTTNAVSTTRVTKPPVGRTAGLTPSAAP